MGNRFASPIIVGVLSLVSLVGSYNLKDKVFPPAKSKQIYLETEIEQFDKHKAFLYEYKPKNIETIIQDVDSKIKIKQNQLDVVNAYLESTKENRDLNGHCMNLLGIFGALGLCYGIGVGFAESLFKE